MLKNADHEAWLVTAARNLDIAEEAGVSLVTPCTGCFGTLKGANHELAADPATLAAVNAKLAKVGRHYAGRPRPGTCWQCCGMILARRRCASGWCAR